MALHRLRSPVRALARVVYPEFCLGCSRPLADGVVCAPCRRRLSRPTAEDVTARISKAESEPFDWACALWRFDAGGTVQRIQHALKYRGRPSLGQALGRDMKRLVTHWRPDLVAPIPLSRQRLLERGYNQAEPLASGLAESLDVPLATHLLMRTRSTRSQATLAFDQRQSNVEGAFSFIGEATPEALDGLHILLVDDVLTTGATLLSAAAPLRRFGARVGVAVLALAG